MNRICSWLSEVAAKETGAAQSGYSAFGAVVGATHPDELAQLRERLPRTIFLIPGMGAQGGTAEDVVRGVDANGRGAVINLSRGIFSAEVMKATDAGEFERKIQETVAAATESINKALAMR
jgi:orotidine-5'-phosphate decarboxylase